MNRLAEISAESYLRSADTTGAYESAIGVESMTLESVVERPEGCSWLVRRTEHDFRVRCGGSMALPLKLEPVMGFLEENSIFRAADMPSLMSDDAKLILCQNMIRNGLLRISKKPAPVIQTDDPVASSGNSLSWLTPNAGF